VVEREDLDHHRGSLDYTYALPAKYLQPFKKLSESKLLKPITELNFNPLPNNFSFSTILDRRFGEREYRFSDPIFKTWFDKRFTWDRDYNLKWDLTKSLKFNFNATNASVIDEPDEYVSRDDLILVDPQVRKDSIWTNLKKFGRTKNYNHSIRASYGLPFKHFPMLDWIRSDISYDASYSWNAAAMNADSLGNTIQNHNSRQFTADLDFTKLYNKSKFLSKINGKSRQGARSRQQQSKSGSQEPDAPKKGGNRKDRSNKEAEPGTFAKVLLRPLMAIRKLRFNYSQDFSTVVPGFTPKSRILGMDKFDAPGWDFILGSQPTFKLREEGNPDWLNDAQTQGWITDNVFQNDQVQQSESETIDGRLTIEPFADFKLDIDVNRRFSSHFSVFYKNVEKTGINFERRSPREIGSFSMSFVSMKTLFMDSEDELSDLFNQFEKYRADISQQRGEGVHQSDGAEYTEGFGAKQRDIIIPAFLAAYTGKDAEDYDVKDVFKWVPRPNWQLNYDGLHKIALFKELFSSVRLSHGYNSTLNINSFETDLNYSEYDELGNFVGQRNENNVNPNTQNYYSRYIIPSISIEETFSPLIGIEFKTQNGMNFSFDYNKRRGLQLGFISNELAEQRSTGIDIGFDYIIKGVELGFLPGSGKKRKNSRTRGKEEQEQEVQGGAAPIRGNDLEILFDFSFNDNITVNHYLDQESLPQPTRGSKDITISPAIRYTLNKNVNLRFFFDYRKTTPYTTTGYPITTTEGGVTIQISLD
jgi:cell surface protein SprA